MVSVIPARVLVEWGALTVALEDVVPRCAVDPDSWFSDAHETAQTAVTACAGCPAALECLTFAVAARESAGVWGGRLFGRGA